MCTSAHNREKASRCPIWAALFFLQTVAGEQYGTSSIIERAQYVEVKTRELTLKQVLSVLCPTCGAATREPCELHTGAQRSEPHRDRKLSAAEAVEAKLSKR